jgi:potassium efflux system protein
MLAESTSRWVPPAPPRRRPRRTGFPALLILIALATAFPPPSAVLRAAPAGEEAQKSQPGAGASSGPTMAELASRYRAKLAEAQAELSRTLASGDDPKELPPGATGPEVIEYRAALGLVVQAYRLHLNDLSALQAVRQRLQDIDNLVKNWTGFAEPPPYPVFLADDLRSSAHGLARKIEAVEAQRSALEAMVAEGRAETEASEGKLRQIGEALEAATDPSVTARLTWQRTLEGARSRASSAFAAYFEERRGTLDEESAELHRRLTFTRRQLALAEGHVSFSRADLDKVLANLDRERARIEGEIAACEAELGARQVTLADANAEAARAAGNAAEPQAERDARIREIEGRIQLESARVKTIAERAIALRQTLNLVNAERDLWQIRFQSFGRLDLEKIQDSNGRLDRWDRIVLAGKAHYAKQIELAAGEIAELENRRQAGAPGDAPFGRELIETYRQREECYRRASNGCERTERLIRCWRETLDEARRSLPFSSRVRDLFGGLSSFGKKFWEFELFVAEDTVVVDGLPIKGRRSVTVGKIVMAILILVIGYWIGSLFSRLLERVTVRRLKVDPNQAKLIGRWVRVVLVIALVIFSLVSVKIPLTVLAFAGGALAIGLGFGTQNILKNFFSGIIILFERPFRIGDVLDVGGQRGLVTSVGIRSSIIKRWDNTETIIPNSVLLENNVTNWTLSNRAVRFTIEIGVAYGTDTRRVSDILAEAVARHDLVQKEPSPQVYFTEFGDKALVFEVRYWIDVIRHNAAQIGSDLRHIIATLLAENGIEIAASRRDVHLMPDRPIAVQLAPRARHEVPPPAPKDGGADAPSPRTVHPGGA